ncbi:MAG: YhbY family RNA-binding protein, partial [Polyangiaceae bacterium]|nr:YhbY family RNA-binding protein [Polyangiaceae bacterium]
MTETDETAPPKRRPAADLNGKQRRHLRGLAHSLEPLVQIGKEGLSSGIESALRSAL